MHVFVISCVHLLFCCFKPLLFYSALFRRFPDFFFLCICKYFMFACLFDFERVCIPCWPAIPNVFPLPPSV